ncbi:MAG: histidine phosphatase family protein [Candidatus Staskawiczbacteria bacterium]|nr:histidine phosphatase family protein [Candidatus Staskawiczbacteria bacterium]
MKLNNKYFLLRHGQTIYQKEDRRMNYDAKENPYLTLTNEGKEMVKTTAEQLKKICDEHGQSIDLIFSSPYERTKETSEIVSEVLGVKDINYDERLVDINLGIFMGKAMEESWKFYLEGEVKFKNKPEGAESWEDILNRVKNFLNNIEKKYKDRNILIVSHADPIWLMAGYLRGFKTEEQFSKARDDRENSYPKLAQLILI